MSFPPGSATAAAFEIACGSEPIRRFSGSGCVVVAVFDGRRASRCAAAARGERPRARRVARTRLATQAESDRLRRCPPRWHPARFDRPLSPFGIRHVPVKLSPPTFVTCPRQTSPLGRYSSWSDVFSSSRVATRRSARTRSFCGRAPARRRRRSAALRAVADHAAGERLVDVRRVPQRRRVVERPDDEERHRDDGHGAGGAIRGDAPSAAEAPDEQHERRRDVTP